MSARYPVLRTVVAGLVALLVVSAVAKVAAARHQAPDAPEAGTSDFVRGRIVGDGGRPISGVLVTARVVNSVEGADLYSSAITDRNGAFEFLEVREGVEGVSVHSPSYLLAEPELDGIVSPGSVLLIRMAKGAVITGRVVDKAGNPIPRLLVAPELVRDKTGVLLAAQRITHHVTYTDDRGVFRLFGLEAGTYLVSAGGQTTAYERQVFLSDRLPTYFPSAPRSGAKSISVGLGAEVSNIEIVYRGDYGHRIAGVKVGGDASSRWSRVELFRVNEPVAFQNYDTTKDRGEPQFSFEDLEDGDYELLASSSNDDGSLTSGRVPVRVRGADVTGVELRLVPKVRIPIDIELGPESVADECRRLETGSTGSRERSDHVRAGYREVTGDSRSSRAAGVFVDGTMTVRQAVGKRYRPTVSFAADELFLERVDIVPFPASTPSDLLVEPREAVKGAAAKPVDGFLFTVGRGAVMVRGRVAPASAGEPLPSKVRVCLVPADPKQKDDVIHYYEVNAERDGTFELRNIAPGEYFVTTRLFPNDDGPDAEILPAAWNATERAKLRAAAEKAGIRIALSPCQRLESAVVAVPARP